MSLDLTPAGWLAALALTLGGVAGLVAWGVLRLAIKSKPRRRTTRLFGGLVRLNWAGARLSSVTVPGILSTHVLWEAGGRRGHRSHDDDRD